MAENEPESEDLEVDEPESASKEDEALKSYWQKFKEEFEKQILQNIAKGIIALAVAGTILAYGVMRSCAAKVTNDANTIYGEASRRQTRLDEALQPLKADSHGIESLPIRSYGFLDPFDLSLNAATEIRVKPPETFFIRFFEVHRRRDGKTFLIGYCIPRQLEVPSDADPSGVVDLYPVATEGASELISVPVNEIDKDPEGLARTVKVKETPKGSKDSRDLMVVSVRHPRSYN